MCFCKG